jgi:hypothetical protein
MPMTVTNEFASSDPGMFPDPQRENAELRATVDVLRARERRLMELLKITAPEKIEHSLRNVLNELVLLRTLLAPQAHD